MMKELKSREGYYLTQSADVANKKRVYITAIKGANVKEDDWREATLEEKKAFEDTLEKPKSTGNEKYFLSQRYR